MQKVVRSIPVVIVVLLMVAPLHTTMAAPGSAAAQGPTVSMEFKGAPLALVFQSLADAAGLNLLLDQTVTGEVTLTLRDHPVLDAMGLIARLNGYQHQVIGNTIIVASPDRFLQGLVSDEHALFRPQHVAPQQAAEMVSKLFPKLTVIVDATERLVLTGFSGDLEAAVAFLNKYDAEGQRPLAFVRAPVEDVVMAIATRAGWNLILQGVPNVPVTATIEGMDPLDALRLISEAAGLDYRLEGNALFVRTKDVVADSVALPPSPETQVVRLNYADPELASGMLRTMWPAVSAAVDKPARALVLHGSQADLDKAETFLRSYDFAPGQVYVEARVEEISLDALRRLGIDWSVPDFHWGGDRLASAVLSWHPSELKTTLELLNETGEATILASPRLSAVDGREARILIGDRIPLIMTQTTPEGRIIETLEYIEAGIDLEITSWVGQDGYITLDIHTEVSSITGMTPQNIPQMRTREATTRIRVKDGQPLIIGGLIQDEERITTKGLPFIQDLPLVGRLFQSKITERVQSETVIFLIPRIVRDDDVPQEPPASAITREPQAVSKPAAAAPPVKQAVLQGPLTRSLRFDINQAVLGGNSIELEGRAGDGHVLSRLYVSRQGADVNWGLGLGVRRYLPDVGGAPWLDLVVDRIQPVNTAARFVLSARVGARASLGERLYVEPYLDYTVMPWDPDPNWVMPGREQGLAGGFRLGWRY